MALNLFPSWQIATWVTSAQFRDVVSSGDTYLMKIIWIGALYKQTQRRFQIDRSYAGMQLFAQFNFQIDIVVAIQWLHIRLQNKR